MVTILLPYLARFPQHRYASRVIIAALQSVKLPLQLLILDHLMNYIPSLLNDPHGHTVFKRLLIHIPPEHVKFMTGYFKGRVFF